MVMDTIQIRLSHGLIERIDKVVGTGIYANRSDVIRDAVRRLVLGRLVGIIPDTGDSVKELKKIRARLSKERLDLGEVNKLAE